MIPRVHTGDPAGTIVESVRPRASGRCRTRACTRPGSRQRIRNRTPNRVLRGDPRRYTNQNLTAAQVIAELVALAKEVSADANRGSTFAPPLNNNELAFYDAVSQNESAVTGMGTDVLASIARDLVRTLRRDVTIDWVSRDDVRAKIRSTIKRLLAKYGYPSDGRDDATNLVLRQMETFADEWSPEAGH
jgi:type I restriction enzyme R subunit